MVGNGWGSVRSIKGGGGVIFFKEVMNSARESGLRELYSSTNSTHSFIIIRPSRKIQESSV